MNKQPLFYLTDTGEPLKYGDIIRRTFKGSNSFSSITVTLSEDTAPLLLMAGVISESKSVSNKTDITSVIDRIALRLKWKPKRVEAFLNGAEEIMPMAAFSIVAREIAVMLDEKYPDHINQCEKVYIISTVDGRIHELNKNHIKNYHNFAAFRTVEDAKLCCSILKKPLKEMFGGK